MVLVVMFALLVVNLLSDLANHVVAVYPRLVLHGHTWVKINHSRSNQVAFGVLGKVFFN